MPLLCQAAYVNKLDSISTKSVKAQTQLLDSSKMTPPNEMFLEKKERLGNFENYSTFSWVICNRSFERMFREPIELQPRIGVGTLRVGVCVAEEHDQCVHVAVALSAFVLVRLH